MIIWGAGLIGLRAGNNAGNTHVSNLVGRVKTSVPSTGPGCAREPDPRPPSDRLEEEIGITPRMIEAGALQLMEFDSKVSSFEDGALNIYRVMLRAKIATPFERALLSRNLGSSVSAASKHLF